MNRQQWIDQETAFRNGRRELSKQVFEMDGEEVPVNLNFDPVYTHDCGFSSKDPGEFWDHLMICRKKGKRVRDPEPTKGNYAKLEAG